MDRTVAPAMTVIAIDDQSRPERRAEAFGRQLVANTATRLEVIALEALGDRRPALRDRLAGGGGAIVVMDVHGGGFLSDVLFDEDAEEILQHVPVPVVALGPAAVVPAAIRTLMVLADEHTPLERPLDLAASWSASLGAVTVSVAHLEAPTTWPHAAPDDHDGRARAAMAARGISGAVQRVPASEPWAAIRAIVAAERETIPVVTTRRWPGADHWFSTARNLIRHAGSPVLVVPH